MRSTQTIYRDMLFLMVLGFVAMVIIMIPHLNPPATDEQTEPPGNLIVHITWPEGDHDVDLWVTGPMEPRAVGYSNKGGIIWNLLRDDLGTEDATKLNYENAYTRGILPGEYIINVHAFSVKSFPITVEVEVSKKSLEAKKIDILVATEVDLHFAGEEKTAIRFKLDEDGEVVEDSMNNIFQQLRDYRGSPP